MAVTAGEAAALRLRCLAVVLCVLTWSGPGSPLTQPRSPLNTDPHQLPFVAQSRSPTTTSVYESASQELLARSQSNPKPPPERHSLSSDANAKLVSQPWASSQLASKTDTSQPRASSQLASGLDISQPRASSQLASGLDTSQPRASSQLASGQDTSQPRASSQLASNTDTSQPRASSQLASSSDTSQPRASSQLASNTDTSQPRASSQLASGPDTSQPRASSQLASGLDTSQPRATSQLASSSDTSQPRANSQLASNTDTSQPRARPQLASNSDTSQPRTRPQLASNPGTLQYRTRPQLALKPDTSQSRTKPQLASKLDTSQSWARPQLASSPDVKLASSNPVFLAPSSPALRIDALRLRDVLGPASRPRERPTPQQQGSRLRSELRNVTQINHRAGSPDAELSAPSAGTPVRGRGNRTQDGGSEMEPRSRPNRGWAWNQFYVLEEHIGPEPQYVGKLHSNWDHGDGSVRYVLSGEGAGSVFLMDEASGDIRAARSLDREAKAQYVLHASALDRRTNRPLEAASEFIVKVQDVNDNAPTFPHGPLHASVPEMADIGTSVLQVTASDADDPTYGNSAKIVYSLLEGQPFFSVDPKTGVIRTAVANMDRESRSRYAVVIQAKDMAGSVGGLSGSTTVNVTLTDVNDNPPKFPQKSYQLYVPETAAVGNAVGRVRANDEDEGDNAEMSYSITNAEAAAMFSIAMDTDHREGVISLKQPLNYEKRKSHVLHIEGANTRPDPRFSHLGLFRDTTSLRVIVGDVDEPPVFSMDYYIMDVYENSPAGTQVGTVTALDPDSTSSAIRYFIEHNNERPLHFSIGVDSGVVRTTQSLDREAVAWHNITVMATEVDNPRLVSHVSVTIQVLDANDNIPSVAGSDSDVIVCEGTKAGQVIQTIRAFDRDNFANGKFSFNSPAELPANPNFTVKDNGNNSASVVSRRRGGFVEREIFFLPVVVGDGGEPPLSSTSTLTLRVCVCLPATRGCHAHAFLSTAGLSTGAFVAILLCVVILLAMAMLFAQLRAHKASREPLIFSQEDVRENVVAYDDEGGGEEDTEAFDIAALRHPDAAPPAGPWPPRPRAPVGEEGGPAWLAVQLPHDGQRAVQRALQLKLAEADLDARGPPYDSLQTYAYEGRGSPAGSVSSLGLPELDYSQLEDWGPGTPTLGGLLGEACAARALEPLETLETLEPCP